MKREQTDMTLLQTLFLIYWYCLVTHLCSISFNVKAIVLITDKISVCSVFPLRYKQTAFRRQTSALTCSGEKEKSKLYNGSCSIAVM